MCHLTDFPTQLWTPEKISGMFIASRPTRCKMRLQKVTAKDKLQYGLSQLDTKQRAGFFFQENSSIIIIVPFSDSEKNFLFLFQLICKQRKVFVWYAKTM